MDDSGLRRYLRYTIPSVVTVGRPDVATTTILIVCLALDDHVLVQIASRYSVVEDFRSTVAVLTPSTYTYAWPDVDARETTQPTERPVKVHVSEAFLAELE